MGKTDTTTQKEQLENLIDVQESEFSIDQLERVARGELDIQDLFDPSELEQYSKLLLALTHESFEEAKAVKLWSGIVNHMCDLESVLDRRVGISVASLDYLTNIKEVFSEPKLIEGERSEFIAQTATIDELTGLCLRDVFEFNLDDFCLSANKHEKPFSLLMIDIDDFKSVNDNYGHPKGDKVLAGVGTCVKALLRDNDLAGRYGGEELIVLLPNTPKDEAFNIAERIRIGIEALDFGEVSVTVSLGLASRQGGADASPTELIKRADDALYQAKERGKNQTVVQNNFN